MPRRSVPLAIGQFYHIFNRGINKQPIFVDVKDYKRAVEVFQFYSFDAPSIRFSRLLFLSQKERKLFLEELQKKHNRLINFICFVLMPNHFHFLVEQVTKNGISKFMSNFQNSYTRYFNTKYKKFGPIFQGQFKAVRIEDENQLLHLSRYIHLNPYFSYVVKTLFDVKNYPWSSLREYLQKSEKSICNKNIILENFKNSHDYEDFIFNQAEYQRKLEQIKHLIFE